MENSAGYLLPHLSSTTALLDVGCGPGTITCDFAERVDSVIGIDVANDVLEKARSEADERALTNVSFEVGSVHELRFADDTFDVVHAHQVLQHLTDPVAAIGELVRVTKPGGIVAVRDADYHAMAWHPSAPELDRWMHLYQAVARANGAEPDAGRRLIEWVLAAGVDRTNVVASADTWLFSAEEERSWWADLWAERTTSSSFAEQARAYGLTTADEQAQLAAGWRRWADEPTGWFIVANGELIIRT